MSKKHLVKLAANFERNLTDIEAFWAEASAPRAYDALLDELLETVIPNLERFPGMGRPFPSRPSGSVEVSNAQASLRAKLATLTPDANSLREYVMKDYLVLYVQIENVVHFLSIKHHRQLSFDFERHFG